MKRATIRDVARLAGVALGTASRVLGQRGQTSADAEQRVQTAARALGYQPDSLAQSLRTRRTRMVGCLLADLADPLSSSLVDALEDALGEAGYQLMLVLSRDDPEREARALQEFGRRRVDGVLIAPCVEGRHPALAAMVAARVPVVVLDRDVELPVGRLLVDHRGGAQDATAHLCKLGHRRIAMIGFDNRWRAGRECLAGYRAGLAAAGRAADPILIGPETVSCEQVEQQIRHLLTLRQPPTAAICAGRQGLIGALAGLREGRRRLPGQFSVVAYGDSELASAGEPAITAVQWDTTQGGRLAARQLCERIDGQSFAADHREVLPTRLIERASTARKPGRTIWQKE